MITLCRTIRWHDRGQTNCFLYKFRTGGRETNQSESTPVKTEELDIDYAELLFKTNIFMHLFVKKNCDNLKVKIDNHLFFFDLCCINCD